MFSQIDTSPRLLILLEMPVKALIKARATTSLWNEILEDTSFWFKKCHKLNMDEDIVISTLLCGKLALFWQKFRETNEFTSKEITLI